MDSPSSPPHSPGGSPLRPLPPVIIESDDSSDIIEDDAYNETHNATDNANTEALLDQARILLERSEEIVQRDQQPIANNVNANANANANANRINANANAAPPRIIPAQPPLMQGMPGDPFDPRRGAQPALVQPWQRRPGQGEFSAQPPVQDPDILPQDVLPYRFWLMRQVHQKRCDKQLYELRVQLGIVGPIDPRLPEHADLVRLEIQKLLGSHRIDELERNNLGAHYPPIQEEVLTTPQLDAVLKAFLLTELNAILAQPDPPFFYQDVNLDVYLDNFFRFKAERLDNRPNPTVEYDPDLRPSYSLVFGRDDFDRSVVMTRWNIQYRRFANRVYAVKSQRDPLVFYWVVHHPPPPVMQMLGMELVDNVWSCNCPHFMERLLVRNLVCKHIHYMRRAEAEDSMPQKPIIKTEPVRNRSRSSSSVSQENSKSASSRRGRRRQRRTPVTPPPPAVVSRVSRDEMDIDPE